MKDEELNKTRSKLENTPFKSASEMNQRSQEIHMKVWERLEYSRLFQKLTENENYEFVRQELKQGLVCSYANVEDGNLVRVFSDGIGIKISISKDLVKEIDKSDVFVQALIRSTTDSFSKSYYQIKGLTPIEGVEMQEATKKSKRKR